MVFSISILPKNKIQQKEMYSDIIYGEIVIGDFTEKFEASLSYWKEEDYRKHWEDGLARILSGNKKSCLITTMYDPHVSNYIFWWPLYREKESIIFHNQILFLKKLKPPFDPKFPYEHIDDRVSEDEDGWKISEWQIPITDISHFLDYLKRINRSKYERIVSTR